MTTGPALLIEFAKAEVDQAVADFVATHGLRPNALLIGTTLCDTIVENAFALHPDQDTAMKLGHLAYSAIGQITFLGFPILATRPDDKACPVLLGDIHFLVPRTPIPA